MSDVTHTTLGRLDKAKFYDAIRAEIRLTTENVSGFDRVLDYGAARGTQVNDFAYILATASWETASTMQPVKEAYWKSEDWRRRNLRYYPWYGRGLIQTTWERNYAKLGPLIGFDLISNPDALLTWPAALPALFVGMEKGLYTGKALDDYIDDIDESDDEDYREYVNARRIVNGTDKAERIAQLALVFERGLKAAGYNGRAAPTVPLPRPRPTPELRPTPKQTNWIAVVIAALIGFAIAGWSQIQDFITANWPF